MFLRKNRKTKVKSSMSNINSILLSLKKSLSVRGYNIDDLIEDYDKRHTGEITVAKFDRLISSFSLLLQPSEYQLIRSTFQKDNGQIDMLKFSGYLKNAHEEVKQRGDDIQADFIDLHNRLTQRNQSLRDLLRPYDRKNRGIVNPYDFIRAVGSFPSSRSLSESYTQNGLINLTEFLNDYEKALQRTGNDSNSGIIKNEFREKPAAVEKAIKQIHFRKVDMRQLFLWHDRFRIGKINRPNFQTALADAGLQLTPAEFNSITEYYSLENGFVDYSDFLNDCQVNFPQEQKIPDDYGRSTAINQSNSIDNILSNIIGILRERKVLPINLFPPNTQVLTKYQFASVLRQNGLNLTNGEIDLLSRSFETQQRDVDVYQFVRKLDNLINEERMTMTRSQREAQMNDMNVVSRIKNALKEKSVQLAPRLSKFDRENSGEFNVSLVNSVLQTLGIDPMTPGELEFLQSIFPGSVPPNIKWYPFTEAIDPPIEECYETIRHNNQRQLNMSIPFGLSNDDGMPQRHEMVERQRTIPSAIVPVLQYIFTTAARYRMTLIEEFRSLDRFRTGFVNPNVFFSFMTNNFNRLNRQQLDLLLNNYGTREFHYIDFCKDLDKVMNEQNTTTQLQTGPYNPSNDLVQRTMMVNQTQNQNISENERNVYNEFLKRLKAFCVCRMMKPLEIFQRHDTMNLGYVNQPRFEGCFTFIQFPLYRNEIDVLLKMFSDDEHKERIIYTPIVRDLDNMKIEQGEAKWILHRKELQQELDSEIIRLLNTIREKLNQRNRRIRTFFSDLRSGEYISPMDFIRRIEMSNIVIPRNDIDKLMEKYMVGGMQKWNAAQDQSAQVDWEAFAKDVENSRFL